MTLDIKIDGLRVYNRLNAREHWRSRARRAKRERADVRTVIGHQVSPTLAPLVVTLTRIAPRPFDDDGLAASFKAIRDEIAALLGRDDNPKAGITWRYEQTRGRPREYAVRIRIERDDEVTT